MSEVKSQSRHRHLLSVRPSTLRPSNAFLFLFLAFNASCDRKQPEAEKTPERETRAAIPRGAPSERSATELAGDSLTTAIGPDAVFKAASDLAKIGTSQAVRLLLDEATSRKDESEVAAIFESLQHLTSPESLNTLAELSIREKSPAVFKAATDLLADRADATTVEVLTSLLYDRPARADRSHKVRLVLQSIRNPAAARALGKLILSAPEPGVIEAAATALGNIATPTARAALQQALDDRPDLAPELRQSIQRSLEKVPKESGDVKSGE